MIKPYMGRQFRHAPPQHLDRISVVKILREEVDFRCHDIESNAFACDRVHGANKSLREFVHLAQGRIELLSKYSVAYYVVERIRGWSRQDIAAFKRCVAMMPPRP